MTALANFGSATRTSLMSRGRSITTDLPMPSCTNREDESEPTTWIDPLCAGTPIGSAANAAAKEAASTAIPSAARFKLRVDILLVPQPTHFDVDMVLMPKRTVFI